ncbi:DUF2335 domain-containing protein [Fibrella sp. HMF5335]|uniref:DUF2335 domain-containing protein n=1 Tax=Fibrella rubiginis TaxID=2817060 RepID=A0A939GFF2_9BACT|nr:DUF2335 domain-containing protein [Fibrella rubiginis]MBO0935463.1 DUF2335 domain-containing protein [Fibrella rubiginis]
MAKHPANRNVSAEHIKRQNQGISVEQRSVFLGPLPHPDILARYEEIQPGLANRIVLMSETEGMHRRETDKTIVRRQFGQARLGTILGFTTTVIVSALSAYCVYMGNSTAAATIACGVLASLAFVFVRGQRAKNDKESE